MAMRRDVVFFTVLLLFCIAVSLFAVSMGFGSSLNMFMRLLALNGFISLSIATIMTPFIKEISLFLKKPFIRVHHYFAAIGLVLVTLHPIILAIETLNPAVFLPNFDSTYLFLFYGGRQALLIIYVAVAAVLLRKRITGSWRLFHALMYVALFFAVVHGNLSGTDFENIFVALVFNALFLSAIAAFALKRWKSYRIKAKKMILARAA